MDSLKTIAVEFPAPDGVVLRGQVKGEGGAWTVLLVHDRDEDLDAWAPLPGMLARAGFGVLTYDQRGHGGSDGEWEPQAACTDVIAADGYARRAGATQTVIVGAGLGATAALLAAETLPAAGLVLLSPADPLAGNGKPAPSRSTVPKLFVVGNADARAESSARAWQRQAAGWSVIVHLPVSQQGTELLRGPWSGHVQEHIFRFLSNLVGRRNGRVLPRLHRVLMDGGKVENESKPQG